MCNCKRNNKKNVENIALRFAKRVNETIYIYFLNGKYNFSTFENIPKNAKYKLIYEKQILQ